MNESCSPWINLARPLTTAQLLLGPKLYPFPHVLSIQNHHLRCTNIISKYKINQNHVGLSETKVPQLFMVQPFPQTATGETSFRWACIIQQVGHQAKPVFHPPRPSVASRHRYSAALDAGRNASKRALQFVQIGGDVRGQNRVLKKHPLVNCRNL